MSPLLVSLQLLEPVGLAWAVAAIALLVLALRLYRDATRGERSSLPMLLLRGGALVVLLLLLLEPVLARVAERRIPARLAVLFDTSLSMSIPWPGGETAPAGEAEEVPTRADRVVDAFAPEGGGLLDRLRGEGRLEAFRFGGGVEALAERPADVDLLPRDDRTDLAAAIVRGVGARRHETGAVVLVSDGAQNVGVDAREEAARLGVPVYAIGVGSEDPVTDLSVFDVAASSVAYLDNDVPVKARLRARGDAAGSVPVYLSEGAVVLDSARVDLPGGGVEREVELRYRPDVEGLHRYRVWTPARDDEIAADNNEHLFAVRVLKEKIRVLLVAGRPSFDLTFLKRALESDVSLEVETVVLSLADFPGELGARGASFPATWAELAPFDAVALLDCGADALDAARGDLVARFVRERGGALLVMGDADAFAPASAELAGVLPVGAGPGPTRRTGAIVATLTGIGRTHPVTRLEADPDVNEARWDELPPLASAPSFGRRAPELRVLVQGAVDGVPRPDLPLVATATAGAGRVLVVAGAPYWRWDLRLWGSGRSGDHFRRFVSRGVRWLVSRDELEQVMVRAGKPLFDGAEDVVIEGQVYDDDFRPIEGADVRATVRGPLGTPRERARELSLVDFGGGRYRGTLPGLPPGDYAIEGRASRDGAPLGEDRSETTVAPYRMEFETPQPDFELLRRVATASGGRFLPLDEAGSLPDLLDLAPVTDRTVREWPLLESPLAFLALLGLLGAEWAMRRRRGLP